MITDEERVQGCQNKRSLRFAIDLMCKDCIYDPEIDQHPWREQVEDCTSQNCPLYNMRPVPDHKSAERMREHRWRLKQRPQIIPQSCQIEF